MQKNILKPYYSIVNLNKALGGGGIVDQVKLQVCNSDPDLKINWMDDQSISIQPRGTESGKVVFGMKLCTLKKVSTIDKQEKWGHFCAT